MTGKEVKRLIALNGQSISSVAKAVDYTKFGLSQALRKDYVKPSLLNAILAHLNVTPIANESSARSYVNAFRELGVQEFTTKPLALAGVDFTDELCERLGIEMKEDSYIAIFVSPATASQTASQNATPKAKAPSLTERQKSIARVMFGAVSPNKTLANGKTILQAATELELRFANGENMALAEIRTIANDYLTGTSDDVAKVMKAIQA